MYSVLRKLERWMSEQRPGWNKESNWVSLGKRNNAIQRTVQRPDVVSGVSLGLGLDKAA